MSAPADSLKHHISFAFVKDDEGAIDVPKTFRAFYTDLLNSSDVGSDAQLCILRMAVQLVTLHAAHRAAHAALGAGGGIYTAPTQADFLQWRDGHVGPPAVLPDDLLASAYADLLSAINNLYGRQKITLANTADMRARRVAARRKFLEICNAQLQHALLNCIKDQPKLKHIKDIPSVVNNLNNFGVISTVDSEMVGALSFIDAFIKTFCIVRCEVEAVAGAASKLFMEPDPFKSLATHISSIKPGIDLLREQNHLTIDDLINWIDVMTRVNYLRVAASSDLPPNVLDVYQKSFDTLTKEMASNPATYTKERFAIIESELRTMLDNRKIDPDNIELPSTLPIGHIVAGNIPSATTFRKQAAFGAPREETVREELIRLRALKDEAELASLRSFARDKGHRIRGRGRGRGGMAQLGPPRSPVPTPHTGAPCFTCGEPGCRPGICNSMHPNARHHQDQIQSKVQTQGDLNTSGHSLSIPPRLRQLGQRIAHIDQDHELSLRLGNSCDWEDE